MKIMKIFPKEKIVTIDDCKIIYEEYYDNMENLTHILSKNEDCNYLGVFNEFNELENEAEECIYYYGLCGKDISKWDEEKHLQYLKDHQILFKE